MPNPKGFWHGLRGTKGVYVDLGKPTDADSVLTSGRKWVPQATLAIRQIDVQFKQV